MEERFTYDRLDRLTGIIEGIDTTGVFTVLDSHVLPVGKALYYKIIKSPYRYPAGCGLAGHSRGHNPR